MKKKTVVSILALLLVVMMLISLFVSILPSSAYALTQADIDAMRKQKDEISNQMAECKERIASLEEEQANVLEQKSALEVESQLADEQLKIVAQELEYYDGLIADAANELNKALDREAEQLRRYRARVRAMEENGGYNILAVIIQSSDFSQFLTALDDIGEIMKGDRDLEDQYIAAREDAEEAKAQYEAERTEYEGKQSELRLEQAELQQDIDEAAATLESLAGEIEQAEKEYEAAELAEASAAAEIQRMITRYNEQKRQQQLLWQQQQQQQQQGDDGSGNGDPDGGGDSWSGDGGDGSGDSGWDNSGGGNEPGTATGSFVWPVPCSRRITGRFNEPRPGHNHAGIDIDGYGNDGGSIVAADGGKVITAQYDSTYGNYIVIDHGGGRQTLYAHMSGFAVSVGDLVSQGQTIGYLGATGNATGTHCHFEIYINSGRVDPAAYFSGLTYWNC